MTASPTQEALTTARENLAHGQRYWAIDMGAQVVPSVVAAMRQHHQNRSTRLQNALQRSTDLIRYEVVPS